MTPRRTRPAAVEEAPALREQEGMAPVALAVKAIYDKKGQRVMVFDLRGKYLYTDFIVVCHGTSDRHVRAICDAVLDAFKQTLREIPLGLEGLEAGQWALLDFNNVIIHVLQEPVRDFYDLEGLWSTMPSLAAAELLPPGYFDAPATAGDRT